MNLKLVSAFALVGAFAVACGDSDNTGGNGGGNGGEDTGGTTNVGGNDGGTINIGGEGGGGGGVPGCYDEASAATFVAGFAETSATYLDLCTEQQLQDFFANCLTAGGDCETFVDNNGPCSGCIFGFDDLAAAQPMPSGNVPPLVQGETLVSVTIAACESAAQNQPQCAGPLTEFLFCGQSVCEQACDLASGEYGECQDYALSEGFCAQTLTYPAECEAILNTQTLSPQCDGNSFEEFFYAIGGYFCGPPPT